MTIRRHSPIPIWLWIPAALGIVFLLVPIIGLGARIDPGGLGEVIFSQESRLAMSLSILTSVIAAIICTVIGFPLGYMLATMRFRGQRVIRTLIILPLVLPPVVSGLALLYTFGRSAVIGSTLESLGLGLAYTTAAVICAQIFVSLPFMVMSVETAVAAGGQEYELAAAELGATPNRVFFFITLPLLRHGIMTGAVLCFARSLGEFGATLTFAGSLSGVTRTMPLHIYLVRESEPQSAIALSLLLILLAVLIIVVAYRSPHAPRLRAAVGGHGPGGGQGSAGGSRSEASGSRARKTRGTTARSQPGGIRFRARSAERGLDLEMEIPSGTTTAIIGRNGAGKSSIFAIMTGAFAADSGRMEIDGRPIFDIDSGHWPPIHSRGIVHLAQNPLLFPHLNVLDNVAFGLKAHGATSTSAREAALDMLDRLGVAGCARRRPGAVSGGQAARIALARALVIDPHLLLLDEPLAALDVDVKAETREVLADVLLGRNVLLITHEVDDVSSLATTLALIDAGECAYTASIGEVNPDAAASGQDFLRSFCETDPTGLLCGRSQ